MDFWTSYIPTSLKGKAVLISSGTLVAIWCSQKVYSLYRRRENDKIRERKLSECQQNIQAVEDRLKTDKVR